MTKSPTPSTTPKTPNVSPSTIFQRWAARDQSNGLHQWLLELVVLVEAQDKKIQSLDRRVRKLTKDKPNGTTTTSDNSAPWRDSRASAAGRPTRTRKTRED